MREDEVEGLIISVGNPPVFNFHQSCLPALEEELMEESLVWMRPAHAVK